MFDTFQTLVLLRPRPRPPSPRRDERGPFAAWEALLPPSSSAFAARRRRLADLEEAGSEQAPIPGLFRPRPDNGGRRCTSRKSPSSSSLPILVLAAVQTQARIGVDDSGASKNHFLGRGYHSRRRRRRETTTARRRWERDICPSSHARGDGGEGEEACSVHTLLIPGDGDGGSPFQGHPRSQGDGSYEKR